MRSSATRWVVAGAAGLVLAGLAFKAADFLAPPETKPPGSAQDAPASPPAERHATAPGAPAAAVPEREGSGAAPSSPVVAPGAVAPQVAEPLDTVHALVPKTAARARLGSAAATNRRSAVAAGPRARRRSGALAAREADSSNDRGASNEPRGPSGTGAILPGENPDERAPTPPAEEDEVVFDSGDEGYQTDTQVAVADLTGVRSGTVSLWLQPQWAEGSQDDASLVSLGDSLQLVKNVNFLRFEALGENGKVTGGVGAPITEWKDGEWHQVTVTWQADQLALYLDGQLVSRAQHVPPVEFGDDAQMFVGSSYPPSRPVAPGVIGQVGLENRPLSPSEVQARFLKTLGQ